MTDPVAISLIGAIDTVVTSGISAMASIRNHKVLKRVESATNGLLKERDVATRAKGNAEGRAQQRKRDKRK